MRSIPKQLLIHNVTHIHINNKDKYGNIIDSTETELTYVRIEPSSAIKLSKDNKEKQLKSTMFYDCVNSLPINISFIEGDLIRFNNSEYVIHSIDLLYDNRKLHHYEVGLV